MWRALNEELLQRDLQKVLGKGITCLSVVLMHSYTYVQSLYNCLYVTICVPQVHCTRGGGEEGCYGDGIHPRFPVLCGDANGQDSTARVYW